jgi:hypothetical protein
MSITTTLKFALRSHHPLPFARADFLHLLGPLRGSGRRIPLDAQPFNEQRLQAAFLRRQVGRM